MNQRQKIDSLDDRLSNKRWAQWSEERLRKEYHREAHLKCKDVVESFVRCSKEQGLMVVFRCRDHNRAMNACLVQHTADFEAYRDAKKAAWIAEGVLEPGQAKLFSGAGGGGGGGEGA